MNEERLGLKVLGELEQSEPDYSFDTLCVWRRDSDGALFYATDRGCSCPSPFEDFETIESLTPIKDAATFEREMDEWAGKDPYDPQGKADLARKVREALRDAAGRV